MSQEIAILQRHLARERQARKAAVALIGLDHHPLASPQAGVGAVRVDDPTVDDRRVHAAGIEQLQAWQATLT